MRRSPVALAVMVVGLIGVAASLTACGSSPEPTATIYITSVPAGSLQSSSVPVAPTYSVARTPPPLTGVCTGLSASLIDGFTGAPTPQLAAQAASAHRLGGLPQPRSPWTALQALAREVYPEASAWAGQRKRETATMMHGPEEGAVRTERRLIQEVTRRHRWRRLHPFHLQITQLPVAGVQGWRVSEDHVVVTRSLRRDVDTYREWLSPVVDELARGVAHAH